MLRQLSVLTARSNRVIPTSFVRYSSDIPRKDTFDDSTSRNYITRDDKEEKDESRKCEEIKMLKKMINDIENLSVNDKDMQSKLKTVSAIVSVFWFFSQMK